MIYNITITPAIVQILYNINSARYAQRNYVLPCSQCMEEGRGRERKNMHIKNEQRQFRPKNDRHSYKACTHIQLVSRIVAQREHECSLKQDAICVL